MVHVFFSLSSPFRAVTVRAIFDNNLDLVDNLVGVKNKNKNFYAELVFDKIDFFILL